MRPPGRNKFGRESVRRAKLMRKQVKSADRTDTRPDPKLPNDKNAIHATDTVPQK